MKIGICQANYTVGDLRANVEKLAQLYREACGKGAQLVVASELAVCGYPPRDFLLERGFVEACWDWTWRLAKTVGEVPFVVGTVRPNEKPRGRRALNTAAVLLQGEVAATFDKRLLPNNDVFDEERYFEAGEETGYFTWQGKRLGITICEDIWNDHTFWERPRYSFDPVEELMATSPVDLLINLSASPFWKGKQAFREQLIAHLAKRYRVPVLYVNQVGANDDLIFDGRSCYVDELGEVRLRLHPFEEEVALYVLGEQGVCAPELEEEEEVWKALVLGIEDYFRKCGFQKALLGLSGGIDSSLVAALAVEALGTERLLGVLMPSPYTSDASVEDAQQLCENLGIECLTLPIGPLMEAYDRTLAPAFEGTERDVTEENIQARIRGNLLMALANKQRALLLTTGNKSELAVGYCTLYGDMAGALAVISDVPKTFVYRLARWRNREREIIPQRVLTKAPSAELRPHQKDQDTLPPYELLDAILHWAVEEGASQEKVIALGFPETTVRYVYRLLRRSEFKRKQMPTGLKVSARAFGTGWRMPIAAEDWNLALDRVSGKTSCGEKKD